MIRSRPKDREGTGQDLTLNRLFSSLAQKKESANHSDTESIAQYHHPMVKTKRLYLHHPPQT